jgi:hypothetical protein
MPRAGSREYLTYSSTSFRCTVLLPPQSAGISRIPRIGVVLFVCASLVADVYLCSEAAVPSGRLQDAVGEGRVFVLARSMPPVAGCPIWRGEDGAGVVVEEGSMLLRWYHCRSVGAGELGIGNEVIQKLILILGQPELVTTR